MRRNPTTLAAILLAAGAAGGLAADGPGPEPAPGEVLLKRCLLSYATTARVGATQGGILRSCAVRPGDRVRAGQALGHLADDDARADLEVRTAEAANDLDVRLNEARLELATAKLKAAEALGRRSLVSVAEVKTNRLEAGAAALAVEEAKHRRGLGKIGLRQAEAALRARAIVSPHDGVVVAVSKAAGEPVGPNEPVFQVVGDDRLRVEGSLDVADAWRVRAGQPVRVWPDIRGADLPVEREAFAGVVEFVDPQIDPETRTCKVAAVIPNRDGLLRSGLEAWLLIRVAEAPAARD